jgi:signal transduction histidine kinase
VLADAGPANLAGLAKPLATADLIDLAARLARGTGLVGLKDRVEALGGRMVIDSPDGAGTSLRVELPLTAGSDVSAR